MVDFVENKSFDRWEVQIPYELGDMKDMKTVAHIENNSVFFVVGEWLAIHVIRTIINDWEEFKAGLDRNSSNDVEKETHFELDPDGVDNV